MFILIYVDFAKYHILDQQTMHDLMHALTFRIKKKSNNYKDRRDNFYEARNVSLINTAC